MTAWLTEDLKKEVRRIFEPRYKRLLSDEEIVDLAVNLVDFVEMFSRYKYQQQNRA